MEGMGCAGQDDKDSMSDASCESLYEVHVDLGEEGTDSAAIDAHGAQLNQLNSQLPPCPEVAQPMNKSMLTLSAEQFQEMVIKALFQSTSTLMGASSGVLHHAGEEVAGFPAMSTGGPSSASTWNEALYRKAEARRQKKPEMMRTSAGEESDSDESFPLPNNATAEQRALRNRRLNRWRAKKARDLTSNRKALKKSPYVIHVDGMSKPRGIHRHQWKATVRGQCSRLDPSMDNINHHPKSIVDRMWHALEKEWEFQGFPHKAREMFEKSATKFMRNRKMHLKHKCQRNIDGPKPDDISESHWAKIVELTKKSIKQEPTCTYGESSLRGEEMSLGNVRSKTQSSQKYQGSHGDSLSKSTEGSADAMDSLALKGEDVDVQIRHLKSELLRLENTKKELHPQNDCIDNIQEVAVQVTKKWGAGSNVYGASAPKARKENMPVFDSPGMESNFLRNSSTKRDDHISVVGASIENVDKYYSKGKERKGGRAALQEITDTNLVEVTEGEMDCGDVVSIVAVIRGKEEDVGTGVLMGFGGSKFCRKVVPKGWCSVKLNLCTSTGGLEACPFPSSWKDQVKQQTLKDAIGHLIVWPRSLVHT